MSNHYDIGIVGAGVGGAALASHLAEKTGLRIALIEQSWEEPDEIIGELLQPDGVSKLGEMGLGHIFESIDAHPVGGYAVYLNGRHYGLNYPTSRGKELHGYGFRYGRFVSALRKAAASHEEVHCIQGTVTSLVEGENQRMQGFTYKDASGVEQELTCALTVLCPGSISLLRNAYHRSKPSREGFMAGIILEDCELPYASSGHVIMADPAPILAYPVGPRKVRVLVDFPAGHQAKGSRMIREHLEKVTKYQLPEELQPAFEKALDKGGIKARGTYQMPGKPVQKPGIVLLGDSLNMRHPLTGAGMTVVLSDIRNLVEIISASGSNESMKPEAYDDLVARFYAQRSKNATMNIMALALYKSFLHPELRQACFDYLSSGGSKSDGPMSLLSGISRNKGLLLKHFFAVGFSAVGRALKPLPTPKRIAHSFSLLKTTLMIILPLLRDESTQYYRS